MEVVLGGSPVACKKNSAQCFDLLLYGYTRISGLDLERRGGRKRVAAVNVGFAVESIPGA